ncbi:Chordopoxvirus fusion protein [Candidatus Magnetobacterium bavaricum]|uniref:Chordopoxvirus fusion protein n=1 Tax=Candidatus Magnetobacterium bavaricum TaxID=29290 RepID=A0A0F3H2J6_9BACT|nr:Chordopoxvirus fusion protein [Candidatus Magnetobacterium bavaricum]
MSGRQCNIPTAIKEKVERMKKKNITKNGNNGNVSRSEFDEFKEMFVELKEMFLMLMQKQDSMAADISTLKTDVGTLKTDVGTLKTDVGTLKTDVISIRRNLGGLSNSVGYALENEAYRELPRFLRAKYGIDISERFIRTEVNGREINILGKGTRHGKQVLIAGEAKLRLQVFDAPASLSPQDTPAVPSKSEQVAKIFYQLEKNAEALRFEHNDIDIVSILITHFATKEFVEEASKKGVIVIQSFEW